MILGRSGVTGHPIDLVVVVVVVGVPSFGRGRAGRGCRSGIGRLGRAVSSVDLVRVGRAGWSVDRSGLVVASAVHPLTRSPWSWSAWSWSGWSVCFACGRWRWRSGCCSLGRAGGGWSELVAMVTRLFCVPAVLPSTVLTTGYIEKYLVSMIRKKPK